MHPWFGKALFLAGLVAVVVIRAPHGRQCRKVKVLESRRGGLEVTLLTLMWVAMVVLPLISIATPLLAFADYSLTPLAFSVGVVCLVAGLWLFYRAHADLGANWSVSLELREKHKLVTHGVYRHIRHPMYAAILLQAAAQALLLPNWVAGPASGLVFLPMFALRLGPEERMMLDAFAGDYAVYLRRTKRLIPNVW